MIIPVVILTVGLLFLLLQKKIVNDIEKLDSGYLGEFETDNDLKAFYQFKRKRMNMHANACKYMGYLFIFWCIVLIVLILLDFIFTI